MKTIAFFNNKGGVGKTTLACNVAAHLARSHRKRVLVVDCDPQCNSTQLILTPEKWSDIYQTESPLIRTLIDIFQPILEGEAEVNLNVDPILGSANRFGVDLIPGHPGTFEAEDKLAEKWTSVKAGTIEGFRTADWCRSLRRHFDHRYDIGLFDLGPSLGALNRSILLGVEFFVTPMGCDIFSILGIQNMTKWVDAWIETFKRGYSHLEKDHKSAIQKYSLSDDIPISRGFVGYTVMQYITKSKGGERRPTTAFEEIIKRIPERIESTLGKFVPSSIDRSALRLGDVPNMFSLVPLAQSANSPIVGIEAADGLAGGQYNQQQAYAEFIDNVTRSILLNMGLESGR